MLNAPELIDTDTDKDELVEAEIEEETQKSRLTSLNKYLKGSNLSKKKIQKIKEKFKENAQTDGRIITIGKKHYIDLIKYDYSDLSL